MGARESDDMSILTTLDQAAELTLSMKYKPSREAGCLDRKRCHNLVSAIQNFYFKLFA